MNQLKTYTAAEIANDMVGQHRAPNGTVYVALSDATAREQRLVAALQAIIDACDRCGGDDDKSLVDEFTQEMEDAARAALADAITSSAPAAKHKRRPANLTRRAAAILKANDGLGVLKKGSVGHLIALSAVENALSDRSAA